MSSSSSSLQQQQQQQSKDTSSSSSSSSSLSSTKVRSNKAKIAVLPQHVVDQIAAGEVVQRPASVVKEFLENSLDAGATHIVVHVEKGGLSKLSVTDNGCGISIADLPLLATRHATSKLSSVEDFATLQTFGFRGEAIASTSMVSRLLTVTTRTADSTVGYCQTYQDGKPMSDKAKPCARKVGTTIVVQDLFYNVLHRQRAYSKRESEEYGKILQIVQDYAIHYPTVGFVCQRTRGGGGSNNASTVLDCNTSQIPAVKALLQSREEVIQKHRQQQYNKQVIEATKQVLSHVLDANLVNHLLYMECSTTDNDNNDDDSNNNDTDNNNTGKKGGSKNAANGDGDNNNKTKNNNRSSCSSSDYKFQYSGQIYFSTPTYNNPKQQQQGNNNKFILFLNDRLVDLPPLKRSLEDVYGDFGTSTGKNTTKPVLVVNLIVPGVQVDVNVHPSKRQVALMYQDDIVTSISNQLRQRLEEYGQSFSKQSVTPKATQTTTIIVNPYGKKQKREQQEDQEDKNELKNQQQTQGGNHDDRIGTSNATTSSQNGRSGYDRSCSQNDTDSNKKRKLAPSKLIRTNKAAPAGAIEPYLISTQVAPSQQLQDRQEISSSSSQSRSPSQGEFTTEVSQKQQQQHVSNCPFSQPSSISSTSPPSNGSLDLSQPGAFADALKCNCPPDAARRTVLVKQPSVRPKRVIPTQCSYSSIGSLRKRVHKHQCMETTQQLRQAFFMGVLSHQRSLIQCGEDLVMINHLELAKELFYQLALARFGGGATKAQLGSSAGGNGGIHIQIAIAQALQWEDDLIMCDELGEAPSLAAAWNDDDYDGGGRNTTTVSSNTGLLKVNETNHNLANQATAQLLDKADMLEEYFSVRIEHHPADGRLDGEDGEKKIPNESKSIGDNNSDNTVDAILTGLPVLLDGHCPQLHGLPIFLLRLATQVDWTEERTCFHGICKELGNYYAMLPSETEDLNPYVKHNLFPALSYLLLPSTNLSKNGHYTVMTKLSTLYKVFERC